MARTSKKACLERGPFHTASVVRAPRKPEFMGELLRAVESC